MGVSEDGATLILLVVDGREYEVEASNVTAAPAPAPGPAPAVIAPEPKPRSATAAAPPVAQQGARGVEQGPLERIGVHFRRLV